MFDFSFKSASEAALLTEIVLKREVDNLAINLRMLRELLKVDYEGKLPEEVDYLLKRAEYHVGDLGGLQCSLDNFLRPVPSS